MKWEEHRDGDWWYVNKVCFVAEEVTYWEVPHETYYEIGQWTRGRLPERYPTLEAAKLAAELMFG